MAFKSSYFEIRRARALARMAHQGQKRKDGSEYFTHLERVANRFKDPDAIIVALLHDTLEDTPLTRSEIVVSFGTDIAYMVEDLTRKEDESYSEYIGRVKDARPIVRKVKMADLMDNYLDCFDKKGNLIPERKSLAKRYLKTMKELQGI